MTHSAWARTDCVKVTAASREYLTTLHGEGSA